MMDVIRMLSTVAGAAAAVVDRVRDAVAKH
jgi:hypothetical protein